MPKALRLIVAFEQTVRFHSADGSPPIRQSHVLAAYVEGDAKCLASPAEGALALERLTAPIQRAMRDATAQIDGKTTPLWSDSEISRFAPSIHAVALNRKRDGDIPEPFVFAQLPKNSRAIMPIDAVRAWSRCFRESLSRALDAPFAPLLRTDLMSANPLLDPDTIDTVIRTLSGEDDWRGASPKELRMTLDAAFEAPALRAVRESELLAAVVQSPGADVPASHPDSAPVQAPLRRL